MRGAKKNKFTAVRLDEKLRKALQYLADQDERTLSDYIRKELRKLVAGKNLPGEQNQ